MNKAFFSRRVLSFPLAFLTIFCAAGCSNRAPAQGTGNESRPPAVSAPFSGEVVSPPFYTPSSSPQSETELSEARAQERYGRRLLPASLRESYDLLEKAMLSGTPDVLIPLIEEEELSRIITFIRRDHPELSWLNDRYTYRQNTVSGKTELRFSYSLSGGEISALKAEIRNAADELLSDIGPALSDFEKALAVFDRLAIHVEYDRTARRQAELAGALLDGKAGCDGYSRAYQYLLNRLGIEALIVYGDAGGPHAWNMVRLEGSYYLADLTWGDSAFEDGTPFLTHAWAFLSDEVFSRTHTPLTDGSNYPLPACNSSGQNFFVQTGSLVQALSDETVSAALSAALSHATARGYPSAQIAFAQAGQAGPLLKDGSLDKLALAAAAELGISLYGRSVEENGQIVSYLICIQ